MFAALNRTLRRQRRRLLVLATVLSLAGVVVAAHTVMAHDDMGDTVAACLAVVETAVAAVAVAIGVVALARRPLRRPRPRVVAMAPCVAGAAPQPRARAGPAALQVFRR